MSEPASNLATVQIASIPGANSDVWWPHVQPFIKRSDKGSNGLERHPHFYMDWVHGNALVWVAIRDKEALGVAMTRITPFPTAKTLWIIALAGSNSYEWGAEMVAAIQRYAREQNVTRIFCQSTRKGMGRLLQSYGFTKSAVIYELTGEN